MKKCTHLLRGRKALCKALNKVYVPSLFQLVEYCSSRDYRKCPFYLRSIVDDNRGDRAASATFPFLPDTSH